MTPFKTELESLTGDIVKRLWNRDALLWKKDPGEQKEITERLGWLTVVEAMKAQIGNLENFSEEIRREGFLHAVVLGMGGSSLCPELLRQTFGKISGFPELHVLDTTDPATILNLERSLAIEKTLFLVSSKSGGTVETDSLFHYFYAKQPKGDHFAAITDPGTSLEELGKEKKFRKIFLNPPDIGGRYSALSYFGLVPAAVMGLDLKMLLLRASRMALACAPSVPAKENPGAVLGTALGALYNAGKDKVTFAVLPPVHALGLWVEQLLAESTGKEGKGLVPVVGEPLGAPAVYGADRLFVYLSVGNRPEKESAAKVDVLEKSGFPVIRTVLESPYDLGGEFFKWEFATAVAGALMQINAFNQPNVQESKDNTKKVLESYEKEGRLPEEKPAVEEQGLKLFLASSSPASGKSFSALLSSFLEKANPGDYIAFMAYLPQTPPVQEKLDAIRLRVRDALRKATTVGFGPRFLHSTGQLHKGGPNTGLFIQFVGEDEENAEIPGAPYTFSLLKQAQALGDYQALRQHGRRVIRVHLGSRIVWGLQKFLSLLEEVTAVKR